MRRILRGVAKPDARIFAQLAGLAGVEPRHVLHIGDDPSADVAGAMQAGMQAAWLNRDAREWPKALAPFQGHLVALGKPGTPERDAAERCYEALSDGAIETLYDDRDVGAGEKFADAELLGCPLRLTVGRRSLESGEIEVQLRRGRQEAPGIALDSEPAALVAAVEGLWESLP